MNKRAVLFIAAVAGCCIVAAGCGKDKDKDGQKGKDGGGAKTAVVEEKKSTRPWEGDYDCSVEANDPNCQLPDGSVYMVGTVFNTTITKGVNVRRAPNATSDVLTTAKEGTKVQIIGVKGSWYNVIVRDLIPVMGWLSGDFVDYNDGRKVVPADLKIAKFNPQIIDSTAEISVVYKVGDEEKNVTFNAVKRKSQKFYTFFFDANVKDFHYSVAPGVYSWVPGNNTKLQHSVSLTRAPYGSMAGQALWAEATLTDDLKFMLIQADPGEESWQIFRASDNKELLDETEFTEFDLRAKTIISACPADAVISKFYKIKEGDEMDEKISEYASEYEINNPASENASKVEVICRTNFETGARTIARGEWK